jgi:hypothetical protein
MEGVKIDFMQQVDDKSWVIKQILLILGEDSRMERRSKNKERPRTLDKNLHSQTKTLLGQTEVKIKAQIEGGSSLLSCLLGFCRSLDLKLLS